MNITILLFYSVEADDAMMLWSYVVLPLKQKYRVTHRYFKAFIHCFIYSKRNFECIIEFIDIYFQGILRTRLYIHPSSHPLHPALTLPHPLCSNTLLYSILAPQLRFGLTICTGPLNECLCAIQRPSIASVNYQAHIQLSQSQY